MNYDETIEAIGIQRVCKKVLLRIAELDKCSGMLFNSEDIFCVAQCGRGIMMILRDRCASTIGSPC